MSHDAARGPARSRDMQERTVAEQVRLLYRNGPTSIVVNLVNAAIVTVLLWSAMPSGILFSWLAVVVLVAVLRVVLLLKYRRSTPGTAELRRWSLWFCLSLAASGTSWGAIGLLATLYLTLPYQVFVAFVVGGMMLGGLAVSGAMMPAYLVFMLPAGLPVAFGFIIQLDPLYLAMGALALVFTVSLYFLGRNINEGIVRGIGLLQALEATNEQLQAEIVERKRVEAVLREGEKRYALATSAGRVGTWDLDLATHDMHLDSNLKAMLGYADHEIENRLEDWDRYVHPDDREQVMEKVQAHLRGLTPEYEVLHRMLHRDGSIRWFVARGTALRDDEGRPCRLVGTDTDVTERRIAEEQARQRQVELAHVVRLSTLGEMTTTLAHELNQPLGAIANYSQACLRTLKANTDATDVLYGALEQITAQARRAGDIVGRLRMFVRKSDGLRLPTDINTLVTETLQFIETDIRERRVQLRLDLGNALPAVRADAVQIQQVLLNLIRNAIEAMNGVSRDARTLMICTQLANESSLRLRVGDTGPGLDEVAMKRVFESFYTTKPYGVGMGLSISRSIVEAHGGRIWVQTPAGGGAEFNFTLPLCPPYNATCLSIASM
ncbi:MAG: PAS domain-containing protein [Gammaproteobacteria bacterium]